MLDASSSTTAAEAIAQRFAQNLRLRRRALARTQEQAALRAGMTGSYWGRVERGAHEPSIRTAARMAAGVDTTLSNLLAGPRIHEKPGS
jgi:transcriptional regulator with XRE-family HTH domain